MLRSSIQYNQDFLLPTLVNHFLMHPDNPIPLKDANKIADYFNRRGVCSGYTILFFECLDAQLHPDFYAESVVSMDWMDQTITNINQLPHQDIKTFSLQEITNINIFISKMMGYQFSIRDHIPQGELQLFLTTHHGTRFRKDFSLAGLFTGFNLLEFHEVVVSNTTKRKRLINFLIPKYKYIIISSHVHDIGVYRNQGMVFIRDANHREGNIIIRAKDFHRLINEIFRINEFDIHQYSPLGFRIFAHVNDPEKTYPTHHDILNRLEIAADYPSDYAYGYNGLHIAVDINCVQSVQFYLQTKKMDCNTVDNLGNSSLYSACVAYHEEILAMCINAGGNVNQVINNHFVPLSMAIFYGSIHTIKLLLAASASCDFQNNSTGDTLLHLAVIAGRRAVIQLLLEYKANPFVSNNEGKLPIHLTGRMDIKLLLLSYMYPVSANQHTFFSMNEAVAKNDMIEEKIVLQANML